MKIAKVAVPFVPTIHAGHDEAKQCAEQLTQLIKRHEAAGWNFVHLESVTTLRHNGCLAVFVGQATSVVTVQVAIFVSTDDD